MKEKEHKGLGRSLRLAVLTLAGLVSLIVVQLVLTLWFSAKQLDESEVILSAEKFAAALDHKKDILAAGVREYAWWTDTLDKMVATQDLDWIAYNFGEGLEDNYDVDEILALDSENRLLYSGRLGQHAPAQDSLGWDLRELEGLIERTQASPMDAPIPYATFLGKGDALYLAAVCAITSSDPDSSEFDSSHKRRPTLILTSRIGSEQLAEFERAHSLHNLRWSLTPAETNSFLPVIGPNGVPLGYMSWDIRLPGAALITQVLLWSAPILAGCILLGAILFLRFRAVISQHQDVIVRSAATRQSQVYFQSMADDAPVLIWQTDLHGNIGYCNRAFADAWEKTGCKDMPTRIFDLAAEEDQSTFRHFFENICLTGKSIEHECRLPGAHGETRWLAVAGTLQSMTMGEVGSILFSASDITDRKNAEVLAWKRANFDNLTQLPNRSLFQDRLGVELAQAERSSTLLGLMFIDLDNFKKINDSMGHGAGDLVLEQAASRISSCVRKPDTVARLGGDEFVVLMPQVKDRADYGKVAQRIKKSLNSQMTIKNVETSLSASIGITLYPEDGLDAESLMMNADTAMYRAKHAGGNSIVYYDRSMNEELKASIRMETNLRRALRNNELFIEYQPIYNSASNEVAGVEALCRWIDRDGKRVPPDKFVQIAERVGLIGELGNYVLERACMQLREWLQEGRDIYLAVNVSAVQFRDHDFSERVIKLIEGHGVDPGRIQFELTEGLLLDDSPQTLQLLNHLAEHDIKIAVDDFGTGYSALSYLRRFPVQTLKIDRAFVHQLPGSKQDQALVRAIITMAHSLGMSVVAEGVETRAQSDFLLQQECELMQGYLYGAPAMAKDLWQDTQKVVPLRTLKG